MWMTSLHREPIRLCMMSASRYVGGFEKTIYQLCQRLDPTHFDLSVCMLRREGPFVELMIRQFDERVRTFDLSWPFKPDVLQELMRYLRQTNPDIIHAFGFKADVVSRWLRSGRSRPALVSAVANPALPHTGWRRWLNQTTGRHVDVYWADCQARAQLGIRRLAMPPDKVKVIYTGIEHGSNGACNTDEPAVRIELGIDAGAPVIASVGNLRFIKGHRQVIEMASVVLQKFPHAVFLFVGADMSRGALPSLAAESGFADHFRFIGFCEDPWPYVQAANVIVVPSLSDELPRALLESMLAGKPVVASMVGGITEVVEHGVNGLLVAAGDTQALAEAVIQLLADPQQRQELGSRAHETVRRRFTVDRMIAEFEKLYIQLAMTGIVSAPVEVS